jgi:hypothetical protein
MIHSVAFPRTFTMDMIIDFLYKHNLKPIKKIDLYQPNWYRVRIVDPKKFKSFYTKVLPNGIHLILGNPK